MRYQFVDAIVLIASDQRQPNTNNPRMPWPGRGSRTARLLMLMAVLLSAPLMAADWYAAPGGGGSACTEAAPCTIQGAIDVVSSTPAGADTIHLAPGTYTAGGSIRITRNDLTLKGPASPFSGAGGLGSPTPAGADVAAVIQPAGSGTGVVWINGAQRVTVESLRLEVNHGRSNEGIVTTGNVSGLVLRDNYLRIVANGGKRNAISINMAAGDSNDFNSTGVGPFNGVVHVTLEGNAVVPTGSSAVSSRALVADGINGVFRNNQFAGQTQDVRVRYVGNHALGNEFIYEGNRSFGAGVWIASPNSGTFSFINNFFYAPGAPGTPTLPINASGVSDPDFSSLKLVGGSLPVTVRGNQFIGYANRYRGLWIQNWPGVQVIGNHFSPSTSYNGSFVGLLVGNKEVWNGAPDPLEMTVTVLGNTFNAGHANANGKAILFVNDNDSGGSAMAGLLQIGDGTEAGANEFDGGLRWYIGLDEHTCNYGGVFYRGLNCADANITLGPNGATPKNSPLGEGINYVSGSNGETYGRPFRFDVTALGNKFGGKLVSQMSHAEFDAFTGKIFDSADRAALGTVDYGTWTAPPITTGTIVFTQTSFSWSGSAHPLSASLSEDASATCVLLPSAVTEVGQYLVDATCTSSTHQVSGTQTVTVTAIPGTVTLAQTDFVYSNSPHTLVPRLVEDDEAICTASPATVTDAGNHLVEVNCEGAGHTASGQIDVFVAKAAGTLAWSALSLDYTGSAHTITATVQQDGSACTVTGAIIGPNVGNYAVTAIACGSANYDVAGLPVNTIATIGGGTAVRRIKDGAPDAFFASVSAALADVDTIDGDTLELAPGVHSGTIVLTKGVTLRGVADDSNLVLDRDGEVITAGPITPPLTVIDGGGAPGDGIIVSAGVQGATIQGLEIRNFGGNCVHALSGNHGITVADNHVHGCAGGQGGIYLNAIGNLTNALVERNRVHGAQRAIIVWNGSKRDLTIRDNHIHGPDTPSGIIFNDGTTTGVEITGNRIENTGDTAIAVLQLTAGSPTGRANRIADNEIVNPGRFGIALQIPNGSGADSGDGAIVVSNNQIIGQSADPGMPTNMGSSPTDRAGISVVRRFYSGPSQGQVDITGGVVIRANQVSAFSEANPAREAYGIVVEGVGSSILDNILEQNQIGLQIQQGNIGHPGDASLGAIADNSDWFDRGNTPTTCVSLGEGAEENTFAGNTVDQRSVPAGAAMVGHRVLNQDTGSRHCSINAAIAAAAPGDTLVVDPGIYAERVVVNKAVTLLGAQAGLAAGPSRSSDPSVASIIVPPVAASGMAYSMNPTLSVMAIFTDEAVVDGFVLDGDNPDIDTGLAMGAADPDVDSGVFASGNHIHFVNNEVRNLVYAGYYGYNGATETPAREGNVIAGNWIHNLDAPSSWGIGIGVLWNYYADIRDNQVTDVRVGVQTNYFFRAAPTPADARITGNLIQASVSGIYHNYHVADQSQASPFTIAGNDIRAGDNPAASGAWYGVLIQTLGNASTAFVQDNDVDGSALASSGRLRAGYVVGAISTSLASNTAIDGGSVSAVDYGVLVTDGAFYPGGVDDIVVRNVDFDNVWIAAIAAEDTLPAGSEGSDNSVRVTVGAGNGYAVDVVQQGALSGANARIEFAPGVDLFDRMLVKAAGQGHRAGLPDSNGHVRLVASGVVNNAIADTAEGGAVTLEAGSFAQNVVVNKEGLMLIGPHVGTHGNDPVRGTGEAVINPATGVGVLLSAPNLALDGLTISTAGGHAVQRAPGDLADNLALVNSRLVNLGNGSGVFSEPGNTAGLGVGFRIARNRFGAIAGSGAANGRGVVLFKGTRNAQIDDNDFDGIQLHAIQVNGGTGVVDDVAITGNRITNTSATALVITGSTGIDVHHNILTGVASALFISDRTVDFSAACNVLSATGSAVNASDFFAGAANSNIRIFHNAISGGSVDLANAMAQGLVVGSNWYDGAAPSVSASAVGLLVADPLPATPIADPLCGDNSPVEIVTYAGTSPQSTPVNAAFGDLRARVQDALGGAVVSRPVTLLAGISAGGATAALGTLSGSSNYNGELVSGAIANGVAGSYAVTAASDGLDTAFALTNSQGSATVVVTDRTVGYDGTRQAVDVTTSPSGLEGDVQVVYSQGATTVATCMAPAVDCGPIDAGVYAVTASIIDNPSYAGSGSGTLTITRALTTIQFQPDPLQFVYDAGTHAVTAHLADEPGTACPVTGTVGPDVIGSPYTVHAADCVGDNHEAPALSAAATVTAQPVTITLGHLLQAHDGSPKSVSVTTAPVSGVAVSVTYDGQATPPTAIGDYAVVATTGDPNYTGSASATLQIVPGTSDIALVLNGPVDAVRVGDWAHYDATMLANPALHAGETFHHEVRVGKSGGDALVLDDLAAMEVFFEGSWIDVYDLFGGVPPFHWDGDELVYHFPEGLGYVGGFPIQAPSWTWNIRFRYASEGVYTAVVTLLDDVLAPVSPAVLDSVATTVLAELPATDIHLVLSGPAEQVEAFQSVEYAATLLADPALHAGERFNIALRLARTGGSPLTIADLDSVQVFDGSVWQVYPPSLVFTQVGNELSYVFPDAAGFPIAQASTQAHFRVVYASTGVYTLTGRVIDNVDYGDPDAAHVFATAAVSTTVVDATPHLPDLALLLSGPLDAIELGSAAQYTGTLLAEPALFDGRQFWIRIRLSKDGGAVPMTVADLARMELYTGTGWYDATVELQPHLVSDGNDLVYLFPQPFGAFSIDNAVFGWNFRFTYGDAGVFSAQADVIDAAQADPLAAPALAGAGIQTTVVATPDIVIDLQGPVVGEVGQALQYLGSLDATPLPDPSELFFVNVRLAKNGGVDAMTEADLSRLEISLDGGSTWTDFTGALPLVPDGNYLSYDFPQPLMPGGFPIDGPWAWNFRFTYADAAVYRAEAVVITADGTRTPVSNTASVQTAIVAQTPDIIIDLQGPVVGEVGQALQYLGSLDATPLPDPSELFFVNVRLAKNGGVDAMTEADLSRLEISLDGGSTWTDFTGALPLVPDGNYLSYDFPQPLMPGGFPIDGPWAWNFRFTYADAAVYRAEAVVITADGTRTPVSNTARVQTTILAQVPDIFVGLQGPVSGIGVGDPAHYTGTLSADPLPDGSEQFIVRIRLGKNGGAVAMTPADLTSMAISDDGVSWTPAPEVLAEIHVDPTNPNFLLYDFPNPALPSFPITSPSWTWHFRFTYGSAGTYGAEATVRRFASEEAVSNTAGIATLVGLGNAYIAIDPASLYTVYDQAPHAAVVTTTPAGLAYTVTYDDGTGATTTAPTRVGSHAVLASIDAGQGYTGSASATLVIAPAIGTVQFTPLTATYTGSALATTAQIVQEPGSSACAITWPGGSAPVAVGSYLVHASCLSDNYTATGSALFQVTPATASIVVDDAVRPYTGAPQSVSATTTPAGLAHVITYAGAGGTVYPVTTVAPSAAGDYAVTATITDANHTGPADTATLVIANDLALVLDGDALGVADTLPVTYSYFTAHTVNPAGVAVAAAMVHFAIERSGGISLADTLVEVEFPAGSDTWNVLALTLVDGTLTGSFGPFALENGISTPTRFRASSTRGGRYTTTAWLEADGSGVVYASAGLMVDVAELDLTGSGNSAGVVGAAVDTGYALVNLGSADLGVDSDAPNDENVHGRFRISWDGGALVGAGANPCTTPDCASPDVSVEFFDPSTGSYQPIHDLQADGDDLVGYFATSAAGMPVPAGHSESFLFRTTFKRHTGNYQVLSQMVGVDTDKVYADAGSQSIGVDTGAGTQMVLVSGDGQVTTVATAFAAPLVVRVLDAGGNPVAGAAVAFNALFGPDGASADSGVATSAGNGEASFTPTANSLAGDYLVEARLSNGVSVTFGMGNLADADPAQIALHAEGGTPQSAPINRPFAIPLAVRVADRFGNALAGQDVVYTALPAAAGATVTVPAATDAEGRTSALATANGVAGSYQVDAHVDGAAGAHAVFALSNLLAAPSAIAIDGGDGQSAMILTSYGAPLSVRVTDSLGLPVAGTSVTFLAPNAGASVMWAGSNAQVVITDADGRASTVVPQANGIAGAVAVSATVSGASGALSAGFGLTNLVDASAVIVLDAGTLSQVHDGQPKSVTAATTPAGLAYQVTYDGSTTAPVAVGSYAVVATISDPSYAGSASATGTLAITPATAAVVFGSTGFVFDGNAHTTTATLAADPDAVCTLTYVPASVIAAGSYAVHADCVGDNHVGAGSTTLVVAPKTVTIGLEDTGDFVYDGAPRPATATVDGDVAGFPADVVVSYNGGPVVPVDVGLYHVVAELAPSAGNYIAAATSAMTAITPAPAVVGLSDLVQVHDGSPRPVTVTTTPAGLAHTVTYDGSGTVPSAVGTYVVVATITEGNYTGSAAATLHIVTGAAASMTANGPTTFTGTAGAPLAGALPSVWVSDSGGNPVAGIEVLFALETGGGTILGVSQNTNQSGIATLGGWILDALPGVTTVRASSTQVGDTVLFEATGAAAVDVRVGLSQPRSYVQYGRLLTYVVSVANDGASTAQDVAVAAPLPVGLTATATTWTCIAGDGASCTASGTGGIADTVTLPAGGLVAYVVTTRVADAFSGDQVIVFEAMAAADNDIDPGNNAADHTLEVVIFRDGFEHGGDGAEWPQDAGDLIALGELGAGRGDMVIAVDAARIGATVGVGTLASAGGQFRIEAMGLPDATRVRLVALANGQEQASDWSILDADADTLVLTLAGRSLSLSGAGQVLQLPVNDARYTVYAWR